ncbi:hypothetical protein MGQ_04405 [Candida albicans P76067]|nr:hypothetical protein MGQ_04405 [Candida albicans P76067]
MTNNKDFDLPPSYDEAVHSSSSSNSNRPNHSSQPPAPPARPQTNRPPSHPPTSSSSSSNANLYTNNLNLPFTYKRGYYCSKCKNSGYKKNGDICHKCWQTLYLNQNAYNPNQKNLPFTYPKGYYCSKCRNTGYKLKNGKSCQNCWESFGPRNSYSFVSTNYQPSYFGNTTFVPMGGGPPVPNAKRVAPGSPELGGILCGNCRGQGMVHFLFDTELCPVCGGLGRVFTAPPPPLPQHPPMPQTPYMPQYQPQYTNYGSKR